ncbi:MAG: DUF1104 domain-containing protein [Campylobacterota bacterium]
MYRVLLVFFIIFSFAFGKVDYSEMSTQELIAIMGYVKSKNKKEFRQELKSRVPTMSQSEKEKYLKNLKKQGK